MFVALSLLLSLGVIGRAVPLLGGEHAGREHSPHAVCQVNRRRVDLLQMYVVRKRQQFEVEHQQHIYCPVRLWHGGITTRIIADKAVRIKANTRKIVGHRASGINSTSIWRYIRMCTAVYIEYWIVNPPSINRTNDFFFYTAPSVQPFLSPKTDDNQPPPSTIYL